MAGAKDNAAARQRQSLVARVVIVGVTSVIAEYIWRHRDTALEYIVISDKGVALHAATVLLGYALLMGSLFLVGYGLSKSLALVVFGKAKQEPRAIKKNEAASKSSAPSSSASKTSTTTTTSKAVSGTTTTTTTASVAEVSKPARAPVKAEPVNDDVELLSEEDRKRLAEIDAVLLGDREAPGAFEKARDLLETMEKSGPVLARLCQTTYWIGEFAETKSEKEPIFQEAVDLGRQAVQKSPNCFEARFWYAVAMGHHSIMKGKLQSAQYLSPLTEHGEWAYKRNPGYFHGGPCRLWGGFLLDCPSWPIGVGDKKKGLEVLKQTLEYGPEFPQNYVLVARAYYLNGDIPSAIAELEKLTAMPPAKTNPGFDAKMKWEAQDLITRYKAKLQ